MFFHSDNNKSLFLDDDYFEDLVSLLAFIYSSETPVGTNTDSSLPVFVFVVSFLFNCVFFASFL